MRYHVATFRFAGRNEEAATKIGGKKPFDIAAARKMLRGGASLEEIGVAQGLSKFTVRYKLKRAGLGYLLNDRERRSEQCAKAGEASAAKTRSA